MMEEIQVKILRLNTGEDIIGSVLMDDKHRYVSIENPMRVVVKRLVDKGQTTLLMAPWLPIELLMDNFATIDYSNILTIVEPKPMFTEYYSNTVLEFEARIADEMEETINEMTGYDYEDSEEDEVMDEILEAVKESKKVSIH